MKPHKIFIQYCEQWDEDGHCLHVGVYEFDGLLAAWWTEPGVGMVNQRMIVEEMPRLMNPEASLDVFVFDHERSFVVQ